MYHHRVTCSQFSPNKATSKEMDLTGGNLEQQSPMGGGEVGDAEQNRERGEGNSRRRLQRQQQQQQEEEEEESSRHARGVRRGCALSRRGRGLTGFLGSASSSLVSENHGGRENGREQEDVEDMYDGEGCGNSDTENYRGFNTSITDMFSDPDQERVDCCALVCCGCLQSDRDRYIVTGIRPTNCWRRFMSHFFSPFLIFCMAMYVAVNVPDPLINQVACYAFVVLFIAYFLSNCCKGAYKRREVRKNILYVKYHKQQHRRGRSRSRDHHGDDNDDDDDSEDTSYYETDHDDDEARRGHSGGNHLPEYYQGQTRVDLWNSHSFIGCYVTDKKLRRPRRRIEDGNEEDDDHEAQRATFLTRIFQCLTGLCCGKLCGVHLQLCGFCAVAQEGRQLEALVRPGKRRIDYITMQPFMEYYPEIYEARHTPTPSSWWYQRLSSLSRWALGITVGIVLSLFGISMVSLRKQIRFGPINFLIFCLTLLQSWAVVYAVYYNSRKDVSVDALIKFFASGFFLCTQVAVFYEVLIGLIIRGIMACLLAMSGIDQVEQNGYQYFSLNFLGGEWTIGQQVNYGGYRAYLEVYGNEHPIIFTAYLVIVTFFLAAGVEEISKYFGYRMIEHPDFLTKSEIEDTVESSDIDELRDVDFTDQDHPHHSKAAAVTVSMVTVAAGFACAENLVYVFIYGGSAASTQASILLVRSLFPIHPLAAAIQSLRVVNRDVEKDSNMKLGRILAPAVIFHGLFDFVILFMSYIGSRQGKWTDEDDSINMNTEDGSDKAGTVASAFVLFAGIIYYIVEARKQRRRLKDLDGETHRPNETSVETPFVLA